MPDGIYVFGYASLATLSEPGTRAGRLKGYRRGWGAAMDNWEGGKRVKHWLDRETGERPRIRVAYLDIREWEGSAVNGLALPVDDERLAMFDTREVNYRRVDVTEAFESMPTERTDGLERPSRVFAYLGLDAARERCRLGLVEGNAFVAAGYAAGVRRAFKRLGPGTLAEFDRTTDPLPFPERDLSPAPGRAVAKRSP